MALRDPPHFPLLPHKHRMWWNHVAPPPPQEVAAEPPLDRPPHPPRPPSLSPSPPTCPTHQQQHGLDLFQGPQAPQEAQQHRHDADPREDVGPDPQSVQR